MKIEAKYLSAMLDQLVRKHRTVKEKKALENIAEEIGLTREYLYKKIYNPISSKDDDELVGLRDAHIELILKNLGFETFQSFKDFVDSPLSEQIRSLAGAYYLYVRRNTKEGALLCSPMLLFENNNQMMLTLHGSQTRYSGQVSCAHGLVSMNIQSEEGKFFHHIYQIGKVIRPHLLQGVFSGVTSTFEPIAGRAVLRHVEEKFENLSPAALDVEKLISEGTRPEELLGAYFRHYPENNLRLKRSTSFDWSDLE